VGRAHEGRPHPARLVVAAGAARGGRRGLHVRAGRRQRGRDGGGLRHGPASHEEGPAAVRSTSYCVGDCRRGCHARVRRRRTGDAAEAREVIEFAEVRRRPIERSRNALAERRGYELRRRARAPGSRTLAACGTGRSLATSGGRDRGREQRSPRLRDESVRSANSQAGARSQQNAASRPFLSERSAHDGIASLCEPTPGAVRAPGAGPRASAS
jgi:hypothetical protein